MHQLIASPFLGQHLIVRPGDSKGVRIAAARFTQLDAELAAGNVVPQWLADTAARTWSLNVAGRRLNQAVLLRRPSPLGYARASWEINKGCDYDCEHCYLGLKRFEALNWDDKTRLLGVMRDAGVLWLQITGGEPLIDRDFPAAYTLANELGMMVAWEPFPSRSSSVRSTTTRSRPSMSWTR